MEIERLADNHIIIPALNSGLNGSSSGGVIQLWIFIFKTFKESPLQMLTSSFSGALKNSGTRMRQNITVALTKFNIIMTIKM